MARWWFSCDRGICLYEGDAVERMNKGHDGDPRCIKHGALLFSNPAYDGLTRKEAERMLRGNDKED